jgi:hypothetical protein
MTDRDLIKFSRPRNRFRLVEPVSLTDEFDSWTFDHFHGLMDFWLTTDLTNKTKFSEKWKLSPTANIKYTIIEQLASTDNNQAAKHIERPSTKALDSFIRDVCHIEDNGLADEWLQALTGKENISTYAHLANLNQQEWEKIDDLPMNALKILKLYVDREKQMAEERKKKKVVDPNDSKKEKIDLMKNFLLFVLFLEKDDSYSKSELRANLHMIKLYFVRQLEDKDGILTLPRLDKYCVETAFNEMREEGYEDDGLFDEMQLFFQPLTVTEDELTINSALLANIRCKELEKQTDLENNIAESKTKLEEEKATLTKESEEFKKSIDQQNKEIEFESEKPPPKDFQELMKRNREWETKHDAWKEKKATYTKKIKDSENRIKQIETLIADWQTSLDEVNKNLSSNKTKIDQRLVKPHRGFIMYGPPGNEKSSCFRDESQSVFIFRYGKISNYE